MMRPAIRQFFATSRIARTRARPPSPLSDRVGSVTVSKSTDARARSLSGPSGQANITVKPCSCAKRISWSMTSSAPEISPVWLTKMIVRVILLPCRVLPLRVATSRPRAIQVHRFRLSQVELEPKRLAMARPTFRRRSFLPL